MGRLNALYKPYKTKGRSSKTATQRTKDVFCPVVEDDDVVRACVCVCVVFPYVQRFQVWLCFVTLY